MRFKAGVAAHPVHPMLHYSRGVVDTLVQLRAGRDTVITSSVRPARPGGSSLHALGLADDHRTRDLSPDVQRALAAEAARVLGGAFDVVLEGPASEDPRYKGGVAHLHVEYDPRVR